MPIEFIQILLILILILINGFFAMAELAMLSVKKLRLQELAYQGNERAKTALGLIEESTKFLSNVQIGITLVGIASGTIGGATLAASLANAIRGIPFVGSYAESISITIVILTITILSLILGELVPKRIAISNPERFALLVAPSVRTLSKLFSLPSKFLSRTTDLLIEIFRVDITNQPEVSLDELRLMIDAGGDNGILKPAEELMLEQILRLNAINVKSIATPRREIAWLDVNAKQSEIKDFLINTTYEKIPVIDGDLDNILGLVYVQNLFSEYLKSGEIDLCSVLIPAIFTPESYSLLQTLEQMRNNHTNLVFVLNEYGGIEGLVSTKDILETIAGDMPEPNERYDPQIVVRADGSLLIDGALPIEHFAELIHVSLEKVKRNQIKTLAGFVLTKLRRIPYVGDVFEALGHTFEIVDMDNNRIDKVLVRRVTEQVLQTLAHD